MDMFLRRAIVPFAHKKIIIRKWKCVLNAIVLRYGRETSVYEI